MQTSARKEARHPVKLPATVRHTKSPRLINAPLLDLSTQGCKIASEEPFISGTAVLVKIPGIENWPATVIWAKRRFVGFEFDNALSSYVVEHYVRQFGPPAGGAEPR